MSSKNEGCQISRNDDEGSLRSTLILITDFCLRRIQIGCIEDCDKALLLSTLDHIR